MTDIDKDLMEALEREKHAKFIVKGKIYRIENVIDLINRQDAEIERLKRNNIAMAQHALILCQENYKEGVKDFAEKFENKLTQIEEIYIDEEHENFISANKVIALLVKLVKETVGE